MWGQLRNHVHREKGPFVTRMGGAMCGETMVDIGTIKQWNRCLDVSQYSDYTSFYNCFQPNLHIYPHMFVGGTRSPNASETIKISNDTYNPNSANNSCVSWSQSIQVGSSEKHNIIEKFFGHPSNPYDCLFCPHCNLHDESEQCQSCHLIPTNKTCTIKQDGITYSGVMFDETEEYIWGDFNDVLHSPNDPFFMLHHINLDRYAFIWQAKNYQYKPYYKFPIRGWGYGLNLNDIMSNEHPFFDVYSYMFDQNKKLTNADVFDATTFENVPYLYDDIFTAIEASVMKKKKKINNEYVANENDNDITSSNVKMISDIVSVPDEWYCILILTLHIITAGSIYLAMHFSQKVNELYLPLK